MDILRTFVTGIELGSFARAADRLGRSPSAISLQLRKLEEQVGHPLLRKNGRGLVLTEAGEILIGYARRILQLNDGALAAIHALTDLEGWLRVGIPPDFAETWFPALLTKFAQYYPKIRVEAQVDSGNALINALRNGKLDLALTWGDMNNPLGEHVADHQLVWIENPLNNQDPTKPLSLVMFDMPCAFRDAAIRALDSADMQWRHTFSSLSLSGIWAAVTAGLGMTVRIADSVPAHLRVLDIAHEPLPPLGKIALYLHTGTGNASPESAKLKDLMMAACKRHSVSTLPGAAEPFSKTDNW
ncbi:LysR family transcriptional regulator [Rhizobium sp. CFBP 8762]|uniref:LysR substrate-binding domain-containing protein n=1 Tax=Rhizobium sp. CFBP 8762 TaxID=2775279 RepID=UPI00177DE91E|nr:LysR substrate-binding domain-containing protein [Rhizobium sp. CFBP 8762]MBD8553207.1 LysR family transcriptional regulator [Rhizobium sp. CFBP 8762]